jgi:hypothetical protein
MEEESCFIRRLELIYSCELVHQLEQVLVEQKYYKNESNNFNYLSIDTFYLKEKEIKYVRDI